MESLMTTDSSQRSIRILLNCEALALAIAALTHLEVVVHRYEQRQACITECVIAVNVGSGTVPDIIYPWALLRC
jgi:hypothetical protein